MKQQSKKLLSLLLAFVLVLGILPGMAFAEEALPETNDTVTMLPLTPATETLAVDETLTPEEIPTPEPTEAPLPEPSAPTEVMPLEAELPSVPFPELEDDWIYFRGNPENNGVTDAKTPVSPETALLKWAQKYGTGWSAAPTPPLILNHQLYIAVSDKILILDKETGAKLDESEAMDGKVGFAMNPLAYGGGMIFAPIGNGQIQALRADTLEDIWTSEKSGDKIAQTVSPVIYHNGYVYTGIWGGEEADSHYICLNAADGTQKWKLTHKGGFYWAGAYVTDNYLIVGSDDGSPANSYTPSAILYSLDPETGDVIDTIENVAGDIRSSVCYDNGKVYFATKGGLFYSVAVGEDGKFDHSTLQSVDLKGMCTGTPMIYNNRAYIGSSGAAQFTGPGYLNVIDLSGSTPELAYRAELPGYPQASALATSAYGETAYVYITYNQSPGGIYAIKDQPNQTEADGYNLYIPEKAQQQFGICSLVCDADGTLYYKNDSCFLMAVTNNTAYLTDLTSDIGNFQQPFAAGTTAYELVVPRGTEQVTLSATPCEDGTITINGAPPAPISLVTGQANASLEVTHETDKREYTVSIREASNNAALSGLAVNESNSFGSDKTLTPTFDPAKNTYACFGVSNSRSFVNLWPTAADANAAVKVYAVSNVDPDDILPDGTVDITSNNGGHDRYALYFADDVKPIVARVEVIAEDDSTTQSYTVFMTKAASSPVSYATSLALDKSSLTIASGTAKLTAVLNDTVGTGPEEPLTWSSSNHNVVTVDSDGIVTCVGGGKAIITVSGALVSTTCAVTSTAPVRLTVSAYDYTAKDAGLPGTSATGTIMSQVVEVSSSSTAAEAVAAAFRTANMNITMTDSQSGPYVTSINGLAAPAGGGMSGWNLSYNDAFPSYGLRGITLSSGDNIGFHYSVNPDGATDDVGNGWYGLPIVTSLTLAGRTVTLSKETTYNPDYSSQTSYYIHSQQGAKVKLQGAGTSGDPFQIPLALPYGTSLTGLTAAYTTSLNEHYRVVDGLGGTQDFSKALSFSLAAKIGQDKTYYKILATTESGGGTPAPGNTISVSFRLIGSTLSSSDVDLGAGGYADASYQTWLKTATVKLPKDATVYDLFTQTLDSAGIRYTGADRNYVDTIYAPTAAGGYALSEFTNGPRSGWMYTVNGTHPGFGLKEQTLHQGDKVVWHYVNDYSYEVKDWFDDPDYPAQGDGKYHDAWLKAADTTPTAPGGDTPKKDEDVTALKPTATTDKNGEAKAEVSAKDVESAITDAKKNGASGIVIEPIVKGSASKVSVELPKEAVAAIAKGTAAKLTVKTAIANISLPTAALSELGHAEGKTVAVSAETVKDENGKATGEVRVEVTANGKAVDSLKGGLMVALPVAKATPGTVLMAITDGGAKIIKKSAVDGTTLSALLGGSATVVAKDNAQTFADVDKGYWGADAISFAASHELFRGTGANTFTPAGEMSRAMLFTVLARMEEQDATGNTWYETPMLWAKEQGISDGTNPDGSISREQLATMLYRYAETVGVDTAAGGNAMKEFGDTDKVSAWAVDAMAWCVSSGLISGKGGDILDPAGTATRGEVAAMLQRLIPMLLK